jgi:hypothetical protein
MPTTTATDISGITIRYEILFRQIQIKIRVVSFNVVYRFHCADG